MEKDTSAFLDANELCADFEKSRFFTSSIIIEIWSFHLIKKKSEYLMYLTYLHKSKHVSMAIK